MSFCSDCPLKAQVYVESIDKRLKLFWGDEYSKKILKDLVPPPTVYSRRDFFGFLKNNTLKAVVTLLPEGNIENPEKLTAIFRKLLLNKLADNKNKVHGWLTWELGQSCWGCGICEKICPEQCIAEQIVYKTSPAGRFIFNPIQTKSCEKCGFLIKPGEADMCSACKTKNERKLLTSPPKRDP